VPPTQRPGQDLLVPFSLLDGLALVAWSLLGQLVVVSLVVVALQLAGVDTAALSGASLGAVTLLTQSVVLAGMFAWLSGRGRLTWRLLGSQRAELRHVLWGLGGGLAAFLVSAVVILTGETLAGPLESPGQSLLSAEMLEGPALLFTFVIASVLAPLLEEVTFRGVLYQAIGRRIGWVGGAVVSAAVFAAVHVEVLLPLGVESLVFSAALFGVGVVFAVVFHRSRNLLAPIVAHATFNGVQLLLASAAG